MKTLNTVIRFLVGMLFIFSGLVKVNDPMGTAIKLHEYFDVFAIDFAEFFKVFIPYSLPLSVFLVVLEVALGVAILVNFRMRITLWVLLVIIIFFTVLTGYSHFTGKVTDCGCFGDAIPLTPYQSFLKDVVLTVMIGWLFVFRNQFLPAFGRDRMPLVITSFATILSLILAIVAIRHLPFIDFRPYKVGVHIPTDQQTTQPPKFNYIMAYQGDTLALENYPTDTAYKYVDYIIVDPGELPKIVDYALRDASGADQTAFSLSGTKLLAISENVEKANADGMKELGEITQAYQAMGFEPMFITNSLPDVADPYQHEHQIMGTYYNGDGTLLKAIIRSNPGIVLIKDGTIIGKWHHNDFDEARKDIPNLLR